MMFAPKLSPDKFAQIAEVQDEYVAGSHVSRPSAQQHLHTLSRVRCFLRIGSICNCSNLFGNVVAVAVSVSRANPAAASTAMSLLWDSNPRPPAY